MKFNLEDRFTADLGPRGHRRGRRPRRRTRAELEEKVTVARSRRTVLAVVSAAAGLALRQGNRRFYRGSSLRYEEEPEAAMVELPLSSRTRT